MTGPDNRSRFIFDDDAARDGLADYRTVAMPAQPAGKADIIGALDDGLDFPDYAGDNWDALLDLLSDLSWLADGDGQARVALVHSAWPATLPPDQLHTYLQVLTFAMGRLNNRPGPVVVAVFPIDARPSYEASR